MYTRLPPDLIQLIYQFDPTFSKIYSEIIKTFICKRFYNKDGTVEREYFVNELGYFHGKFIIFHKQQILQSANYKNGKLHGLSKEYHLNGVFRTQINYKDGKIISKLVKTYFDNGILFCETEYDNGKRHGLCKMYNKDGTLRETRLYKNGKRHGVFTIYNTDATLREACIYKNDKIFKSKNLKRTTHTRDRT